MDTPLHMRFALEIFVEYAFRVPYLSTRPQSLYWFALLCASLVLYAVGYNDLFRFSLVFWVNLGIADGTKSKALTNHVRA